MAYRRSSTSRSSSRSNSGRRSSSRSNARRPTAARRSSLRSASRSGGRQQTVRIELIHKQDTGNGGVVSLNPGVPRAAGKAQF